jgi:hypothetical protein
MTLKHCTRVLMVIAPGNFPTPLFDVVARAIAFEKY